MPYVNPLDDTVPADTDLLRDGDDAIREFKDAIIERLLTIVADVEADPMQLIIGAFPDGLITGPKLAAAAGLRRILYAVKHTVLTVPATSTAQETVAVPGAVVGDVVVASFTGLLALAPLFVQGWVSAVDTVTLYYYNPNAADQPQNQDVHIAVISQTATGT